MIQWLEKHKTILFILILLFALTIRIGLIANVTEPIDRDAKEYFEIAQNIVTGNGFSINGIDPTTRRSPGYPAALACVMAVFGSDPQTLYIFQAMINVLTIFLIFLSLKYIEIKSPLQLFVVLLFSLNTSFIYINVLYAEILTMFFIALILFFSVHPILQTYQSIQSILIGIIIGILIYLRPSFLYLPFFLMICIAIIKIINRHFPIRQYLLIIGITMLMIAPWTTRNYVVFQRFIPLVSAGGGELWGANFEIADHFVWNSVSDIQKYEDQRTANHALQNRLIDKYRREYALDNPEDLNKFLHRQGKAIILAHPFRYAILCLNRFLIFWFSPPIGATTMKSISPVLFWMVLIIKYLMTICAITGLWQLSKHHFEQLCPIILLVIYLTFLHSAVHSIQRYFLPLIPICYFVLGFILNIMSNKWKINHE